VKDRSCVKVEMAVREEEGSCLGFKVSDAPFLLIEWLRDLIHVPAPPNCSECCAKKDEAVWSVVMPGLISNISTATQAHTEDHGAPAIQRYLPLGSGMGPRHLDIHREPLCTLHS
jgi:hypothetical protein